MLKHISGWRITVFSPLNQEKRTGPFKKDWPLKKTIKTKRQLQITYRISEFHR